MPTQPPRPDHRTWWTVGVLGASYALAQTGSTLTMTVTALTGSLLSEDPALATLPLAIQFLATMIATIPAAELTTRAGARLGFSAGQLVGAISAALAAVAVVLGDYWLFVAASGGIGIHNAVWQRLRFAAGDAVEPAHRARAISYLLAGGVVAALLGPWLATHTRDLFTPAAFAGSFIALSGLCLINASVLQAGRYARIKKQSSSASGRPLRVVARQPVFVVAALSAAIGFGAMILVMTTTPLAVTACGFSFEDAAWVIQWHVLAMYVPSFFTGRLIERYGAARVIGAGAALNVVTALVNVSGMSAGHFWLGLVCLGVAWNLMFVGGTSLLAEAHRPEEQGKIQGLNDFVVFGVVATASLSSGVLYATVGWAALNSLVAVLAVIVLLAVGLLVRQKRALPASLTLRDAS
jgi:MFS family permease